MSAPAPLEAVRRQFAEELQFVAGVQSERVVTAFAAVPRERFLGPGPWQIHHPVTGYWQTPDDDPRHVYHNVVIALAPERGLNNGEPSLWARLFDAIDIDAGSTVLHIGCGTGYYSAVLAEIVGSDGQVTAVELDEQLAGRARAVLGAWPQVTVRHADGSTVSIESMDVVVISAGATHPLPAWLDALAEGGRLVVPLTTERRGGFTLLVVREGQRYAAQSLGWIGIFPCAGGRNAAMEAELASALGKGTIELVRSLRRAPHAREPACWLHGREVCLSMAALH